MFSKGLQMMRSQYLRRDLKWRALQQCLTVKSHYKAKVKTIVAKLSILDVYGSPGYASGLVSIVTG